MTKTSTYIYVAVNIDSATKVYNTDLHFQTSIKEVFSVWRFKNNFVFNFNFSFNDQSKKVLVSA